MEVSARFKKIRFSVQVTDHANMRMVEREITLEELIYVIEFGKAKKKPQKDNAYWVFLEFEQRNDNLICASIIVEGKNIVVKTVLINWRPT